MFSNSTRGDTAAQTLARNARNEARTSGSGRGAASASRAADDTGPLAPPHAPDPAEVVGPVAVLGSIENSNELDDPALPAIAIARDAIGAPSPAPPVMQPIPVAVHEVGGRRVSTGGSLGPPRRVLSEPAIDAPLPPAGVAFPPLGGGEPIACCAVWGSIPLAQQPHFQ